MITFAITIDENGFLAITNHIGQYIIDQDLQKIITVAIFQRDMLEEDRLYALMHNQRIIDNINSASCHYTSTKTKYRKKISKTKRQKIFELHGKKCLSCGSEEKICIDHVLPLFHGGSDDIDNLQPLCNTCNLRKKTKTIDYRKS